MNSTEFHLRQLEMRQAEITEVVRILSNIANGSGSGMYQANSRGEGQNLQDWKGRLDLSNIIIAGQSFGGNSVFRYLAEPNPFLPAGAAIPYDPGKDSGPFATTNVKVPLLIPDSEEWSSVPTEFYGQQHFDVVKSVAQSALTATGAGWFMTLLGTVHTSITDVGLIAASFADFFTNETQLITLAADKAILDFANVTVDFVSYVQSRNASNIKGILASGVTYPSFQLFPNASTLLNPWEVHVAPNA
jgi:platelet-activating factor acetylhydrolase